MTRPDAVQDSTRFWTAAVLAAVAPLVVILCVTLWRTPFPLNEIVALLEDIVEQPLSHFVQSGTAYFRPLFHLLLAGLWLNLSMDAALTGIRLLTIIPVILLVALTVHHLRPRTALDGAAAALSVAVLLGSPGFRDNLEIGLSYTIIGMLLALVTWMVAIGRPRPWSGPLIITFALIAIGFKEQGLVVVVAAMVAWWTRAPGISTRLAGSLALIVGAYLALRLSGSGTWDLFQQDIGLGFNEIERGEAAARFGAFPYWVYAYNALATVLNVLFSEPTRGIFRFTDGLIHGGTEVWHLSRLASSATLTTLIGYWGVRALRRVRTEGWDFESRLFLVFLAALAASGALSFNYSRDRLGGMAALFYALAAFHAVRAAALRAVESTRLTLAAAAIGFVLLSAAWQTRTVATLEYARMHAWGNQEEWFVRLASRRIEYTHRRVYVPIMESLVEQGTIVALPTPTRYPAWLSSVIGYP